MQIIYNHYSIIIVLLKQLGQRLLSHVVWSTHLNYSAIKRVLLKNMLSNELIVDSWLVEYYRHRCRKYHEE